MTSAGPAPEIAVSLLTGGGDRPYVYGLATALMAKGVRLDVIGSDEVDFAEFHDSPNVNFLNLRGDQNPNAGFFKKAIRVLLYYARLIRYAATARPKVFHILWNNRFEAFDRTLLMLYYRLLGKKTVLTLHNVNTAKRDSRDSFLNRLTLRIQYRLADHIFLHTEKMKQELSEDFGIPGTKATVIPFGINNSVPSSTLTCVEARKRLGIREEEKVILFFGNITPYKGLEYLVEAFQRLREKHPDYRLVIAGRPKGFAEYWASIQEKMRKDASDGRILLRADFVPDEETEIYFKAADVLALPYRHIYQSGVLFLGYFFGLPVLAADVGSLKEEVAEGRTGFVFRPEDPEALAQAIERYFTNELFAHLDERRQEIREYAGRRYSWNAVSEATVARYASLLHLDLCKGLSDRGAASASLSN